MNETEVKMHAILKAQFGFDDFRPGQEEVLTALLVDQQNVLAVLPTGTGKSLLYEYAGYVLGGTTVIVSPLLSLMQDQVARLNYHGQRQAVAINSMMKPATKNFALQHLEQFRYIFIAPETLVQEPVMLALQRLQVNLFVVDEAHSIAQWGPDFRPDYLELGRAFQQLGQPRLLALTATASETARHEILAQFNLPVAPQTILYSVNRPNIHLRTERLADDKTKQQRLLSLVKELPGAGIIYLSSKKLADQLVITLQQANERRVAAYHGDVTGDQRYAVQQQFMANQLDVIVATSAFGMGIDKADIRWVIHYHLSNDLEAYVQEIGRAGRDQQPALAVLLYGQNDEYLVRNLIDTSLPVEGDIQHFFKRTPNYTFDPQHERLLNYYQNRGLSAAQVTQLFRQRVGLRFRALAAMLDYIEAADDKRNYLLKYFGETPLEAPADGNWSTEQTPLDIPALNLPSAVEQVPNLGLLGWRETLENLFG
ncbi:ATP-dependent DNA helicase RecQ [Periweissella cryptocerci]|uniref:ATP-dependent DNA helicase RecQ n=1 Tax=Periweissella cryptocerci TaxID=2506420 RepID=A0A4P6YWZ0_9LACO|nr:RecQ family ATP-dependent DNA helicase [Periweissella cryptocerci]QBO37307.1 ATP-dependent DNA helicase RecQ [Periweissella cryptocerci]